MENKCAACKNAEAEVTVRVADRETGAMSNPVPLCRNCLSKVSKTRKVEIVKELIPEADVVAPKPSEDVEVKIPLYQKNVRKITNIFDKLEVISAVAAMLFAILLIAGFLNRAFVLGYVSIAGTVSAALSWVFFHVLSLAAEAVDDYLDTHK